MKGKMGRTLMVGLIAAAVLGTAGGSLAGPAAANDTAPRPVKSRHALLKLLKRHQPKYTYRGGPILALPANGVQIQAAADTTGGGAGYSTTTVQVDGVDEGDVVKTDGQFIYSLKDQRVLVTRANPATALEVVAELEAEDGEFWPYELYVAGDRLVVIGSSWRIAPGDVDSFVGATLTKAVVYDITDPTDIQELRTVEIEGDYLASRKIDDSVYLVGSRYPHYYTLRLMAAPAATKTTIPVFRDSAASSKFQQLNVSRIWYLPDFTEPNYLLVAGFNLHDETPVDLKAYLGAGQLVYASRENLYVSATRWRPGPIFILPAVTALPLTQIAEPDPDEEPAETTVIYRFGLQDGQVTFSGQGEVPGTILNQFSLDEHAGHLRVATTTHGWWNGSDNENNVYVLGPDLDQVGALEGLAPGEQIYAARFIGQRGYLVTFRTVDPLFVIDLADPAAPSVLGELHIPGFSNYLHPYDETHLIGFGKDVIVVDDGTGQDPWLVGRAFPQGLKIALFDVSDVAQPRELYKVTIGVRGTDSELLWDHHALLFNKTTGLLAFPVSVAEYADPAATHQPWDYGQTVFQGAYVYRLALETGFAFQGRITHLDAAADPYDWTRQIHRALTIGNDLFTLSDAELQAHDALTLLPKAALELP